jgi:hypothetical protein
MGRSSKQQRSPPRKGEHSDDYYSDDYSDDSDDYDRRRGQRGGGGGRRGANGGGSPRGSSSKTSSPRKARRVAPLGRGGGDGDEDNVAWRFMGLTFVGLRKFFEMHDDVRHDDFDAGVRAMALMCTLMLLVPFQVLASLGNVYLDDMVLQAAKCHGEQGVTYERIYTGYRVILLVMIYSCVCGQILSLFYFLFKRTDTSEYKAWYSKARTLVILIFFCTSFAICSLITMSNWLFDYYLLNSSANICANGTTYYILPGLIIAGLTFFVGFYLIL